MLPYINTLISRWHRRSRQMTYRKMVEAYHNAVRELVTPDDILRDFAKMLRRELWIDTVLTWVYQPDSANLHLANALGRVSDPTLAELFPLDLPPTMLNRTLLVAMLPEGTSRQGLLALGLQAIIPIQLRGTLIALVGIHHQHGQRFYTRETVHLLNLLAGGAALALRNAYLEQEVDNLRPVYRWTIDAREEERRHLAAELHDDVMAQLTTLTVTLNMARSKLIKRHDSVDPKIIGWLATVEDGLPQVNRRLREMMQGLYPSVLTNLGLIAALRTHMDGLSRQPLPPDGPSETAITITAEGFSERIADPKLERDLYFVTRQSIDNAVRHAHADQILVHLRWGPTWGKNMISVTVRDTGRGMKDAPEALTGRNGRLGLVSMRERIAAWDGHLSIDSQPDHGTTILARVPINQPPAHPDLQQATRVLRSD